MTAATRDSAVTGRPTPPVLSRQSVPAFQPRSQLTLESVAWLKNNPQLAQYNAVKEQAGKFNRAFWIALIACVLFLYADTMCWLIYHFNIDQKPVVGSFVRAVVESSKFRPAESASTIILLASCIVFCVIYFLLPYAYMGALSHVVSASPDEQRNLFWRVVLPTHFAAVNLVITGSMALRNFSRINILDLGESNFFFHREEAKSFSPSATQAQHEQVASILSRGFVISLLLPCLVVHHMLAKPFARFWKQVEIKKYLLLLYAPLTGFVLHTSWDSAFYLWTAVQHLKSIDGALSLWWKQVREDPNDNSLPTKERIERLNRMIAGFADAYSAALALTVCLLFASAFIMPIYRNVLRALRKSLEPNTAQNWGVALAVCCAAWVYLFSISALNSFAGWLVSAEIIKLLYTGVPNEEDADDDK